MERPARKSDMGGYAALSDPVTLKPRCLSRPASDAMAVPQIPMICTCCCSISLSRLTDLRCGFQYLQFNTLLCNQLSLYTERQRNISAAHMTRLQSKHNR